LEKVIVSKNSLEEVAQAETSDSTQSSPHWTELWPTKNQNHKH
jgi:hypothetical protein